MIRGSDRPKRPSRKLTVKRITLNGYKTYGDSEVNFDDYNLLIGANASGKSNLVTSLRFVRDVTQNSIDDGAALNGGFGNFTDDQKKKSVGFEFDTNEPVPLYIKGRGTSAAALLIYGTYRYEIGIDSEKGDYFEKLSVSVEKVDKELWNRFRKHYTSIEMEGPFDDTIEKTKALSWEALEGLIDRLINLMTDADLIRRHDRLSFHLGSKKNPEEFDKLMQEIKDNKLFFESFHSPIGRYPYVEDIEQMDLLRFLKYISMGRLPLLDRIKIFDFEAKKMKEIQEFNVDSRLYEDGSNLALVLRKLLKDKERSQIFIDKMKRLVPSFDEFKFVSLPHTSAQLLVVKEKFESKENEIGSLGISDGTVVMMGLVYALFFDESDVIILEEPERSVHPALIKEIMLLIKEASKKKQIIVTTHNPEFLRWSEIDKIRLIYRSEDGYSHVVKPLDLANVQYLIKKEIGIEYIFVNDSFGV